MCQRLLTAKSSSIEDENLVIGKLKMAQSANFTASVEALLFDVIASDELDAEFQSASQHQYKNLSVQILGCGWKLPSRTNVSIPPEMQLLIDAYSSFYLNKRPQILLTWRFKLGELTLKYSYKELKFDLVMLPIQAIILLLFNNNKKRKLNYIEIAELSGISEHDILKRILHSLSCPNKVIKIPILSKDPSTVSSSRSSSKTIDESDVFSINESFNSRLRRVSIYMYILVEEGIVINITCNMM